MVVERYRRGPGPVYARVEAKGRMLPEGLHFVDSWVVDDVAMDRCFQLMETDDPALFDTTMSKELLRLSEAFDYTPEVLAGLVLAGVRHSFLPQAEKSALEVSMRTEIATLAERHLGRALAV